MSSGTVTIVALAPTHLTCCQFPAPCAITQSGSPQLHAHAGAPMLKPHAHQIFRLFITITFSQSSSIQSSLPL